MRILNDEQVKEIRQAYVPRSVNWKSPNVMELAKKYKVSQQTIRDIALGRRYKDVA